jgi:hypothetical protein
VLEVTVALDWLLYSDASRAGFHIGDQEVSALSLNSDFACVP